MTKQKQKDYKEYKYMKGFTKINIASICRKLNYNRPNIMNGFGTEEQYKLIKEEIEKSIARLYLGK